MILRQKRVDASNDLATARRRIVGGDLVLLENFLFARWKFCRELLEQNVERRFGCRLQGAQMLEAALEEHQAREQHERGLEAVADAALAAENDPAELDELERHNLASRNVLLMLMLILMIGRR